MKTKKEAGFIKAIILLIIAIAVLSYYGINLRDIWEFIVSIWNNFLAAPAIYLWHLWVQYIWTPFINSLNTIKN